MEAGFVAVEEGERGVGSGEGFEGESHPTALLEPAPIIGDAIALPFHFDTEEAGLNVGVAGQAPMDGGELPD